MPRCLSNATLTLTYEKINRPHTPPAKTEPLGGHYVSYSTADILIRRYLTSLLVLMIRLEIPMCFVSHSVPENPPHAFQIRPFLIHFASFPFIPPRLMQPFPGYSMQDSWLVPQTDLFPTRPCAYSSLPRQQGAQQWFGEHPCATDVR